MGAWELTTANRVASPRTRLAIVLSVLLLFFAVALFSPLHKHTLGKSTSCSFNNLEHQMVSLAEAAVVVAPVVFLLEAAAPPAVLSEAAGQSIEASGRAPPALS